MICLVILFFGVGSAMSDDYDDDVIDNDDTDVSDDLYTSISALADSDSASAIERERARRQLESDIEAFLASGGKIQSIDSNVMADPPKKPQSNYGGQPI